jgi:hypothetical protein
MVMWLSNLVEFAVTTKRDSRPALRSKDCGESYPTICPQFTVADHCTEATRECIRMVNVPYGVYSFDLLRIPRGSRWTLTRPPGSHPVSAISRFPSSVTNTHQPGSRLAVNMERRGCRNNIEIANLQKSQAAGRHPSQHGSESGPTHYHCARI